MPNVLLRIYPNGDILFSVRISLVLFCPMESAILSTWSSNLQNTNGKLYVILNAFLPFLYLNIRRRTDGYTTEDVVFLWKEGDPVQITSKLNLSRFTLLKYFTEYCTSKTNTGAYSCIKVSMLFKREFSYYLILIYVPCCMLVIVSWVRNDPLN